MTTAIKTGTADRTQAAGSPGICRYPGCASPARVKDPAAPGPRPGYCEQEVPEDRGDGTRVLVRHTAMTAFRHRQQLAGQLCPSVRRRGSAGGRAAGPTGRGPEDSTGRRARRLSTLSGPALAGLRPGADRPGAGDPSTASGAHAQPADRPRAGGQPRYGQKARQPPAGQARRGQRTEAVTRARSSA